MKREKVTFTNRYLHLQTQYQNKHTAKPLLYTTCQAFLKHRDIKARDYTKKYLGFTLSYRHHNIIRKNNGSPKTA